MSELTPERKIYTVSQLNRAVKNLLEAHFRLIWLEGEVSNLARPASGHLYFSLKDAGAQIRCALFRNRARSVPTTLSNGQQILARARISLYEPRGDYQIIIEHLEDAGEGVLRRAFALLQQKLAAEGLFVTERKQALPTLAQKVGVITSPSGAAIRDVLSVLKRRFPSLPVLIYPVQVQGETAARQIASALNVANKRRDCDVLLLVRGGGSLEDLQAFNEEIVARAIAASTIPLVSGVGHEVDVTIADFVADVRAATPSAAAELISPDQQRWLAGFRQQQQRLQALVQQRLNQQQQTLRWLIQRLLQQHPGRRLQDRMLRLDELEQRLQQTLKLRLERQQHRLQNLQARLQAQNPLTQVQQLQQRFQMMSQRLQTAMRYQLEQQRQRVAATARALHGVSPLQTLERGYAIVCIADTQEMVRRADQVTPGTQVEALLAEGKLLCRVE